VICKIMPADHMPVDEEGNRADIVMDPNSTINRANPGRLYEQYFNSAARDTHKRLCSMLGIPPGTKESVALAHIQGVDKETFKLAWDYLLGLYAIVSPRQRSWFDNGSIEGTPEEYVAAIVELGIAFYFPTDNPPMPQDMVTQIEDPANGYKPVYGPVTYVDNGGKRVMTYNKIRIGGQYFILLEKTGDDWGSVASGKLQHHGVLSQLTRTDKYSNPARNQAVRGAGEAEVRIFASYMGSHYVAEMMDRNNSPQTHRVIVDKILSAPMPTNVDSMVDRAIYPYGGAKPLMIVKHLLQSSGVEFHYTPYDLSAPHYSKPRFVSNKEAAVANEERE
jgi:hypothetical protein